MPITLIEPTPISPSTPLPSVGSPSFSTDALNWVNNLTNVWVGQFNALAQATYTNASVVASSAAASAASSAVSSADAAAAAVTAVNAANAASAAAGATQWVRDAAYSFGAIVWGATQQGVLYRCTLAHSGVSTPPENDPAHWVSVGARATVSPASGPSSITLTRAPDGTLSSLAFTQDGKSGTVTLTRAGGVLTQVETTYDGKTRTETLNRTGGVLSSITAVES